MKYALQCSSSDENYDADCNIAVVDMTPEFAKQILARRKFLLEHREKEPDLLVHRFYDRVVDFLSAEELPELDDGPVPLTEVPNWEEVRIEAQEMVVCDFWVWFECRPKHTNITIHTCPVRYDWLESQIK